MMNPNRALFACLTLILVLSGCTRREAVSFCDDRAGLLSAAQRARLQNYHRKLLEAADIHLQLTILDQAAADLDRVAVDLVEQDQIGGGTRGARGVLFLVDPGDRQVRLEIGYDLEGVFPDGFVARIEHGQMIPFFAAGRVAEGVEATVELLVGRALEADLTVPEQAAPLQHLSGGAGARVGVTIGDGGTEPARPPGDASQALPGASPDAALAAYLRVLASRDKNPDLPLYTPETSAMLHQWLMTDAQQDSELNLLSLALERGAWFTTEALAVLRFPPGERQLPPYFFQRGDRGWMLDLAAMRRLVAFNHLNQWHFRDMEHPYMFAFRDLRFDSHGFPHPGNARD